MIQYIILSIIVIIILFKAFLKINHPFWSIQPAFHIYDINHWIFPNKIIDVNLPKINKYVKPYDVKTFKIGETPQDIIKKAHSLIRGNYLRNKQVNYIPKLNDITMYLETSIQPSFISVYSVPKTLYCEKGTITDVEIKGVITARPLYLTCKGCDTLCVNYIDNMCTHKDVRKQGIGQILIQTHEYNIRHLNPEINICLFKREGDLTAIVPLTTYDTIGYNICNIPKLKLERTSTQLVRCTAQTFTQLVGFIKEEALRFECVLQPEKMLFSSLIINEQFHCYMLIEDNEVYAIYIFRHTESYVDGVKGVECIATINKCPYRDTFVAGFCTALRRTSRKLNCGIVWIDKTADSLDITSSFERYGIQINSSCPNAFFLYNFAKYSHKPESCLFLY